MQVWSYTRLMWLDDAQPSLSDSQCFPSQDPAPIPQTGSSLQVPQQATLAFRDEELTVVQQGKVLRRILRIGRLIFWTGFNGTRVFTGTAPVPIDEIFGGGM